MSRFTGHSAIVFAASRGIGRASAERLGEGGAAVAVNYLSNRAQADEVVAHIVAAGGQAFAVQGDVAAAADVERVFADTIARFGKVDIVINAAGQSVFKPMAALTDEDFERVFSINARGAMYVLRAAAGAVADGGRIIQFSTGGTKWRWPAPACTPHQRRPASRWRWGWRRKWARAA